MRMALAACKCCSAEDSTRSCRQVEARFQAGRADLAQLQAHQLGHQLRLGDADAQRARALTRHLGQQGQHDVRLVPERGLHAARQAFPAVVACRRAEGGRQARELQQAGCQTSGWAGACADSACWSADQAPHAHPICAAHQAVVMWCVLSAQRARAHLLGDQPSSCLGSWQADWNLGHSGRMRQCSQHTRQAHALEHDAAVAQPARLCRSRLLRLQRTQA